MISLLKNFYSVPSYSNNSKLITPANGSTLVIKEFGTSGCLKSTVKIEMKLGDELLFSGHESISMLTDEEYDCNGIDSLTINLINDSSETETIGGWIKYYLR